MVEGFAAELVGKIPYLCLLYGHFLPEPFLQVCGACF